MEGICCVLGCRSLWLMLRQKKQPSGPASRSSGSGVSAALHSRDAGEGCASRGDPGCYLGDWRPVQRGEAAALIAMLVRAAKS